MSTYTQKTFYSTTGAIEYVNNFRDSGSEGFSEVSSTHFRIFGNSMTIKQQHFIFPFEDLYIDDDYVYTVTSRIDNDYIFICICSQIFTGSDVRRSLPLVIYQDIKNNKQFCFTSYLDSDEVTKQWNISYYDSMPILSSNELRLYPAYWSHRDYTKNCDHPIYTTAVGSCQAGTKVIDTNGNRFLALGNRFFVRLKPEDEW